jgi:hypothetical protein
MQHIGRAVITVGVILPFGIMKNEMDKKYNEKRIDNSRPNILIAGSSLGVANYQSNPDVRNTSEVTSGC